MQDRAIFTDTAHHVVTLL